MKITILGWGREVSGMPRPWLLDRVRQGMDSRGKSHPAMVAPAMLSVAAGARLCPIGAEPHAVMPEPKEFDTLPAIALAGHIALHQIQAVVRAARQARCEAR